MIENFERFNGEILTEVNGKQIVIQENDFFKYLQRNDKLEWSGYQTNLDTGETESIEGEISLEEYFEKIAFWEQRLDLTSYLELKGIMNEFDATINQLKSAI